MNKDVIEDAPICEQRRHAEPQKAMQREKTAGQVQPALSTVLLLLESIVYIL